MDLEKRVQLLNDRLAYIGDIFGPKRPEGFNMLAKRFGEFKAREASLSTADQVREVGRLEDLFAFVENQLESTLTPMDKVRVVRHPQRVCLKDILEHVYDNYTEMGGQDEYSIDPSMLIARAYITRRVGKKVINQPVMVIGQEKGHGQEFRNGGSVKPWGNAKALQYMKVAETENIPIHTYVFTPGSYPIEDYPGAAQQIARNLYEMSTLRVPVVAVFSEGGSGGAEAIGLADVRMMMSHGYYSVISPEGAAAIEGRLRSGQRATPELIDSCAEHLKITAGDNLENGYIDRVIDEPPLGARPQHYDFFRTLRGEVIAATNEAVLNAKGLKLFRARAMKQAKEKRGIEAEDVFVRWSLTSKDRERLVWQRYKKFRSLAQHAYIDQRGVVSRTVDTVQNAFWDVHSFLRYELFGKRQKKIKRMLEEAQAESRVVTSKVFGPISRVLGKAVPANGNDKAKEQLTQLSRPEEGVNLDTGVWAYQSPRSQEDKAVSCPKAGEYGCLDMWAPDLFGDFAGVCSYCGYHFPMEYEWYLHNLFDQGSVSEFNGEVECKNPNGFPKFEDKLTAAKAKTNLKSACVTFEASIDSTKLVCAMLVGSFRGGSVGAAEGEKFIRAVERASKKHLPLLAYVHGTAGIRIQEGVNGVIQMPRCTMAVRNYIDEGGLYLVLYDTNSYAGPLASFLGCSPYQFSVRSANIGFAGPGVIKETTNLDIPPDYHQAHQALSRGHIQGIWDRRELKKNLHQALLTMGGRNLYYR